MCCGEGNVIGEARENHMLPWIYCDSDGKGWQEIVVEAGNSLLWNAGKSVRCHSGVPGGCVSGERRNLSLESALTMMWNHLRKERKEKENIACRQKWKNIQLITHKFPETSTLFTSRIWIAMILYFYLKIDLNLSRQDRTTKKHFSLRFWYKQ